MSIPAVSVITPVGAGGLPFLAEAYRSLRTQGVDFEWLIQLDGPVGDVPAAIAADARVNVAASPRPVGIAAARNLALGRVRAPLVATLDADDELLPDAFLTLIGALADHPEAALAFGQTVKLSLDGSIEPKPAIPLPGGELAPGVVYDSWTATATAESSRPPFACAAAVWRTDVLLAAGGWVGLPVHEDIALVMAVCEQHSSVHVAVDVYAARRHEGQTTQNPELLSDRIAEQRYIHARVGAIRRQRELAPALA
jgi:glycosyltransferase involved in cell wall biosynthesis